MATGSPGTTGTTGPRPWPTPSWKEEELSGLGEGTEEKQIKVEITQSAFLDILMRSVCCENETTFYNLDTMHFYCGILWRFLFFTSIKAPYSTGHGLSEDHPVLLGGCPILNMRVVIHANL